MLGHISNYHYHKIPSYHQVEKFELLDENQHLQFYTHACVEIKIHACPFICCVDTNTLNVNKEIRVQYNSSYEKTTFSEV